MGYTSIYTGLNATLRIYEEKLNPTSGPVKSDCANSEPKKSVASKIAFDERVRSARNAKEIERAAARALRMKK